MSDDTQTTPTPVAVPAATPVPVISDVDVPVMPPPVNAQDVHAQVLQETASKSCLESKKWIMTVVGVCCVMFTYGSAVAMCAIFPQVASFIASLANIVIVFLGSVTGAYTVGQSFVDWKQSSTMSDVSQNSTDYSMKKEERTNVDIKEIVMSNLDKLDPKHIDDLDGLKSGEDASTPND